MINTLILIAVVAWILQILLGWRQISRFNRAFEQLCKQGNVGIGRTKGRFKPKVVIAVAFDQNQWVTDSLLMKGYTVFASPRSVAQFKGLHLREIDPHQIFPNDKACQEALSNAIH